jgi:hypothetical protein
MGPHEMLGYGDANTRYGNVMFSAYMNEASAAAAIVILSKLVTGNTSISQTFKTKLKAIINLIVFFYLYN